MVLLLTGLTGGAYLWATGTEGRTGHGQSLAELEQAIACPDATTDTWLRYAQCLEDARRYDHAAAAYQRVLESDPYGRVANLHCAAVLALAGDGDRLLAFLTKLTQLDPRLALDVFARPELRPFLKEARFDQAHKQAVVQSMD
jgi:tetratricopeptide (TPR) repeat protein